MVEVDEELIAAILKGNADEKVSELYLRWHRPISTYFYSFTSNPQDVEDLTQIVFLKVIKNIKSFRRCKGKFSTWIYTIARNTALNFVSQKQSQKYHDANPILNNSDHIPENRMLEQEKIEAIRSAINRLKENQKTALYLREYQQYSYQEIAKILDCSEGAVKQLLFRARQGLMKQLVPYFAKEGMD
ncbi:MAG: sigma-70 family RNA polymerase sigma factor [Bacillota bacterium]